MACWMAADRHVDVISTRYFEQATRSLDEFQSSSYRHSPSPAPRSIHHGLYRSPSAQPHARPVSLAHSCPACRPPSPRSLRSPALTLLTPVAHPCHPPSPCSLLLPTLATLTPVTRPLALAMLAPAANPIPRTSFWITFEARLSGTSLRF